MYLTDRGGQLSRLPVKLRVGLLPNPRLVLWIRFSLTGSDQCSPTGLMRSWPIVETFAGIRIWAFGIEDVRFFGDDGSGR